MCKISNKSIDFDSFISKNNVSFGFICNKYIRTIVSKYLDIGTLFYRISVHL